MNRRRFFTNLFGIAIAPKAIVKAIAAYSPVPIYNFIISSVPIVGKRRKLKAKWTCELKQDLEHWYSDENGMMRRQYQIIKNRIMV